MWNWRVFPLLPLFKQPLAKPDTERTLADKKKVYPHLGYSIGGRAVWHILFPSFSLNHLGIKSRRVQRGGEKPIISGKRKKSQGPSRKWNWHWLRLLTLLSSNQCCRSQTKGLFPQEEGREQKNNSLPIQIPLLSEKVVVEWGKWFFSAELFYPDPLP